MASPVFIVGAGAVGLHLAARLAPHVPVTLVARGARVGALARDGFELTGLEQARLKLPVRELRGPFPPDADVLLAVKATQLAGTLGDLRLRPGQPLGLVQTGLGVAALTRSIIPHAAPVLISGWHGVLLTTPLTIRVNFLPTLELAADLPHLHPTRDRWQGLLERAGLTTRIADSIQASEWRQSLWHLAVAGLCATVGERSGAVLDSPPLQGVARAILDEARAVAAAEGVTIRDADIDAVFALAEVARETRSSVLHDLARGVATEMPFLNAEVARRAGARGQTALVNAVVARLVEHLERRPREEAKPTT